MLQYLAILIMWMGAIFFSEAFFFIEGNNSGIEIDLPILNKGKIVLIVLDALRDDFELNLNLPNITYLTKAHPPTVTLPRLRALLNGNIPNFAESWQYTNNNNFTSNWLSSYLQYKKGLFFGDESWSQIIPTDLWAKHEYVTSFHAIDTVECDANVTRNVYNELKSDWDIMVLHYLGLDHVGHCCGGPSSHLFKPKLEEYSKIITDVYQTLSEKDYIVVLGDHGMTDAGQHGGSTLEEVSTKAIFINSNLKAAKIDQSILQIDLVPILAQLTSGKMSKSNLGIPPNDFRTSGVESTVKKQLLHKLLNQNREISTESLQEMLNEHFKAQVVIDSITLESLQEELLNQRVKYDYKAIQNSLIYMTLALFPSFVELVLDGSSWASVQGKAKLFFIEIQEPFHLFLVVIYLILSYSTLFSSSFIEEQHMLEYFVFTTMLAISLFDKFKTKKLGLKSIINTIKDPNMIFLIVFKFVRYWNQTGDKWLHQWDYSKILQNHPQLLLILISVSTLLYFNDNKSKTCASLIILFKANQLGLFSIPQIQYLEISVIVITISLGNVDHLLLLFAKPANIPLLIILFSALSYYKNNFAHDNTRVLLYFALSRSVYFLLGNSNSLSTIDITSAFIGLTDMNIYLSPIYVYITTFGPSLYILLQIPKNPKNLEKQLVYFTNTFAVYSFYIMTLSVFFMRDHLFIWTVYSPRYVYEFGWQITFLIYIFLVPIKNYIMNS
eukprot:NODE_26_length_40862_cov_0.679513.p6 type:complete len:724 gc:universal NODE_26_length_40862_cov_0.679513:37339-39510(+)